MNTTEDTDTQTAKAVVELIPWDECICGSKRRRPRPDCWATEHDCDQRFDRAEGEGRR